MWQTENDLRTRIQELSSGTGNRNVRLLDTITETDGSAGPGKLLANRLMDRVKRVVQGLSGRSQPAVSQPASTGHAK